MATKKNEKELSTSKKKTVSSSLSKDNKTTKKASEKKTKVSTSDKPAKKTVEKLNTKKIIDPRTGRVISASSSKKPIKKKEIVEKKIIEVVVEKKKPKAPKLPKKSSKELTIELPPKEKEPLVRPTPKKAKELTKEEKVLYKQLEESFSFIANLATVIEDRTMDKNIINDLTIGELHVIETVNKNNNKPMSLIARAEHVTVGALTISVNRLVQKGYILRTRDEMDHRVILLSITPKGKKILKTHDKFHSDILGLALENINLAQSAKVMNVFAQTLEYYYDPTIKLAETKKRK